MAESCPHYLCVYGTLKPGFGNNHVITAHDHVDLGRATTVDMFMLNEGFPFVWAKPATPLPPAFRPFLGKVVGHLYRVSDDGLSACDRLEGHPRHYVRTDIPVKYAQQGGPVFATAGIYLAPNKPTLLNLQRPIGGFLEWGRARREDAMEFQRVKVKERR